ncbi:uncharacterized protein LOC108594385 isoform X2 [Drosophila busckii]|uniref:uncharacterized protein LOC108594385 isoform X2 n=1 Tax=Drosophila busckii TaxID=30019 RepID=UPI00083EDC12|nr:uncharacterized protein LOC108594385 isoform X2 [Drosophila busckii]
MIGEAMHRYQLFFSNLSREKTPQLREALELLDWSVGYKVSAIHETHNNVYKQLIVERQLCLEREMNTKFYSMPCEKAKLMKISCPSGYYLDKVRLEHAVLINELWPARHAGSLKLIELLIEHNTSVGLYEQETGQLCAWCLRLQSGFLGALQVLETHQRRGFAAVVAAAISQKIAKELEQDVTALVSMDNAPAARVFEKLHFTLNAGEHYYWSMCLPHKGDTINWPDKQ